MARYLVTFRTNQCLPLTCLRVIRLLLDYQKTGIREANSHRHGENMQNSTQKQKCHAKCCNILQQKRALVPCYVTEELK